jgi:predicted RNase H-like HicB family nuclease
MTTTFTAIFAKGDDWTEEDGWIVGWVRELPGAIVQERTIEEARRNMKEVITLLLEIRDEENKEFERDVISREPITVDI